MVTLALNGAKYRTRLLPRQLADAFARCLRANDRFTGINVEESRTAKHAVNRWFVAFHPSNPAAMAALLDRQQDVQHVRAEAQWMGYLVVQSDRGPWFYVENLTSGEVYEVDAGEQPGGGHCTCPHYEQRCRPALIECKHPEIVRLQLQAGWALTWDQAAGAPIPVQSVPSAEQLRRRDAQRDRELLWG